MATSLIQRTVLNDLRRDLRRDEIMFLVGPRQAGKTTLMKILQAELEQAGERTLFLSLDFDLDRAHFTTQESLLRKIELELGKGPGFVFIDEIQRKENAGLFLKGLQDRELPYRFIVSGSGSVDLKASIRESMVGRKRVYDVYPLSLAEFVDYRTGYRYAGKLAEYCEVESARAAQLLEEYLNYGGYPRVVLESEGREKLRVLDEIYQGYVAKDIAALLNVEKIEAYGQMLRLLADQVGKLVNYSELALTLGLSLPTVRNYCWYAEETYVLSRVTPFFRNVRSEISKAPTVYFSDPGFRNYALGLTGELRRSEDLGFAFQNLVYLILREKLRWTGADIHFWRTTAKTEIDFVVERGRELVAVEVKYREMARPQIPRAFDGFVAKYQPVRCLVVNRSLRTTTVIDDTEVRFVTPWDLLFGEW